MNWIAIGAVAEVVGVVALIVSLIYLAMQIRQNTFQIARSVEAEQLSAFERNIDSGNTIRELLVLNKEVAVLFLRGLDGYQQLDTVQKLRFDMLMRNMFSSTQGAYIRQLSIRKESEDNGLVDIVDSLLVNSGVRAWLIQSKPDWRPEFKEFVDHRLALIERSQARDSGDKTDKT